MSIPLPLTALLDYFGSCNVRRDDSYILVIYIVCASTSRYSDDCHSCFSMRAKFPAHVPHLTLHCSMPKQPCTAAASSIISYAIFPSNQPVHYILHAFVTKYKLPNECWQVACPCNDFSCTRTMYVYMTYIKVSRMLTYVLYPRKRACSTCADQPVQLWLSSYSFPLLSMMSYGILWLPEILLINFEL